MTESSATLPQDPCSDNGQSLNQDPLASQYGSNCLSLNNNVNPNLVISAQVQYRWVIGLYMLWMIVCVTIYFYLRIK